MAVLQGYGSIDEVEKALTIEKKIVKINEKLTVN